MVKRAEFDRVIFEHDAHRSAAMQRFASGGDRGEESTQNSFVC